MKKIYWVYIALALLLILSQIKSAKRPKKDRIKQMAEIQNANILNDLHPAVKSNFIAFVNDILALGYTPVLTSGYRSFAKQQLLKEQDHRNASAGFSSHNYGMAIDLVLVKGKNTINKNSPISEWEKTGVPALAKRKYGMRWGGEFAGYPDTVHFDYQNKYPTNTLYKLALNQFGTIGAVKGNEVRLT